MLIKTRLLIVHHRHLKYRNYIEQNSDEFEIESIDFRDPVPFDSDDSDILFCWKIQQDLITRMTNLKWIAACSAGVDHIIKALPADSTLPITRAKGTMGRFMAEYVLQHILNHIKNYDVLQDQQRQRIWRHVKSDLLSRYTIGIVGLGSIGSDIAAMVKSLGMTVFGSSYSPGNDENLSNVDEMFHGEDWRKMLPRVDFLVLTVPHTEKTEKMISTAEFKMLKPSSVLINIARGPIVDQEALISALITKEIAGAILDVFNDEPLADSSPLWRTENLIISPHCAGPSEEESICDEFLENYQRWKSGKSLRLLVDRNKGY